MATIAELKARLSADVGEFVAGMATANTSLSGFMTKSALMGGALTLIGVGAIALGRHALDMGTQFDAALDSIQTKTGATGKELAALGESTRAVFRSIPTDLQSAADAVGTVNQRLDLTGKTLETVSKQFLELSRLTGTDLQTNINSAADALLKWNVPAQEIPGTLDMIFRASQQSGASFERLSQLLTDNAAVLQQFGFTLPEATALLASFEKSGVNTETAMRGLKEALANFAKAGVTDAKQALEDVFTAIKNAPTDIEATQIAIDTFGRRAGPELAAAIRSGRLDLDSMLAAIENGEPTILGTAEATNDFSEKLQILKNRLNDLLIPLGSALFDGLNDLIPVLTLLVTGIEKLEHAFGALAKPVQDATLLAFAPLKVILQSIPLVVDGANAAVDRLKTAFEALKTAGDSVKTALSDALDKLKIAASDLSKLPQSVSNAIGEAIASKLRGWSGLTVLSALRERLDSLALSAGGFLNLAKSVGDAIANAIKSAIDGWSGALIKGALTAKLNGLTAAATDFAGWASSVASGIAQAIKDALPSFPISKEDVLNALGLGWVIPLLNAGGGLLGRLPSQSGFGYKEAQDQAAAGKNDFAALGGQKIQPPDFSAVTAALATVKAAVITTMTEIVMTSNTAMTVMSAAVGTRFAAMAAQAGAATNQMRAQVTAAVQGMSAQTTATASQMQARVQQTFAQMQSQASSAINQMRSAVTSGMQAMASAAGSAMNQFASQVQSGMSRAVSATQSGVNQIRGVVSGLNLSSQGYSIGASLGQGIASGIQAYIGAVASAAAALVSAAITAARTAAAANSPSKKMMALGGDMAEGLTIGLERGAASVAAASAALIDLPNAAGGQTGTQGGNTYVSIALRSQELVDLIRNAEMGGQFAEGFGAQLGLYAGAP